MSFSETRSVWQVFIINSKNWMDAYGIDYDIVYGPDITSGEEAGEEEEKFHPSVSRTEAST